MSVFGITNYLLVTQKGRTYIPFVRGTGFLVDFESHGFFTKHVITAGHVAVPLRYSAIYGRPPLFSRIGERHLTPKILLFDHQGQRRAVLPLEPKIHELKGTCITSLRVKGERELFPRMYEDGVPVPVAYDLDDPTTEIGEGEELVIQGLSLDRDQDPSDVAEMKPIVVQAKARLSFLSELFGATVIASTGNVRISPGMSGSPVLRKSNGKCVGMLICGVKTKLSDPAASPLQQKVTNHNIIHTHANSSEDREAKAEDKERRKKVSIFNEERLPRRVSDETAMQLAVKEFEEAHKNMEPPMLDLIGQDGTLEELKIVDPAGYANDETDEQFVAIVPIKDFYGALRFSEKI
jgi:hypothetical protein